MHITYYGTNAQGLQNGDITLIVIFLIAIIFCTILKVVIDILNKRNNIHPMTILLLIASTGILYLLIAAYLIFHPVIIK